jgi:hypothetical protein
MLRSVMIAAGLLIVSPALAQHGPEYPSESSRGPAFPSSVSGKDSSSTNWVSQPPIQDDGLSVAERRWDSRERRWRR